MSLTTRVPHRAAKAEVQASGVSHCAACRLEHLACPELRETIRAVFGHEMERFGPEFPRGFEYRKHWETAMAARALEAAGALHERSQVLGVGAGNEPVAFWLTNRVRRVFATDLYLDGADWQESANPTMLIEPSRHWPAAWNPRRLVVQHMNALDLRYEDAAFDAVFSSSSIEHFGGESEVLRAIREMHRVLKPGGVLSLSTELRLDGPAPGIPSTLLFDAEQVRRIFLDSVPWEPMGDVDLYVSPATLATEQPLDDAIAHLKLHIAEHGEIVFHRLSWNHYPHLVLRSGEHLWTSFHLALRKPG